MHDHNQVVISDWERSGIVHGWTAHMRLWLHKDIRLYAWIRTFLYIQKKIARQYNETFRVRDDEKQKLYKKDDHNSTGMEWTN